MSRFMMCGEAVCCALAEFNNGPGGVRLGGRGPESGKMWWSGTKGRCLSVTCRRSHKYLLSVWQITKGSSTCRRHHCHKKSDGQTSERGLPIQEVNSPEKETTGSSERLRREILQVHIVELCRSQNLRDASLDLFQLLDALV